MNRIVASLLVCATFAVGPLAALAAPITVPTGLNPGDQYRLAFVTSTKRDGESSNIADYNAFVTTAANSVPELAALGTSWKAIASTSSVAARDNTGTNPFLSAGVPIYTLADALMASSNSDLWDGFLLAPINVEETGFILTQGIEGILLYLAWTGSDGDGLPYFPFALGSFEVNLGSPFVGPEGGTPIWINVGGAVTDLSIAPENLFRLFTMSDVLTVVPEPSTMVLACLAAAGLAVSLLRRRCGRQAHFTQGER